MDDSLEQCLITSRGKACKKIGDPNLDRMSQNQVQN